MGDRSSAQRLGPGERVEGQALVVGAALLAEGDRLRGTFVRAGDLADLDHGLVLRDVGEHLAAQHGVVTGLRQRLLEEGDDVGAALLEVTLGQQQVRRHSRGAGRQRLDPVAEQVREALLLARVMKMTAQGEHPLDVRDLGRGQPPRVAREVDRQTRRTARAAAPSRRRGERRAPRRGPSWPGPGGGCVAARR